MQVENEQTPYEVVCPSCRVTFAAGTKQCIHCGARLGKQRSRRRVTIPGLEEEELVDVEAAGKRSFPISPVTLLWVVLLVGAAVQRACESM